MHTFLMPTVEETTVVINFNDGQEPLSLDLVDIENMQNAAWGPKNEIPEDSSFEHEFCRVFYQKYQRHCSRTGARQLVRHKQELMEKLKKSLLKPVVPSDSSEQDTSSQNET